MWVNLRSRPCTVKATAKTKSTQLTMRRWHAKNKDFLQPKTHRYLIQGDVHLSQEVITCLTGRVEKKKSHTDFMTTLSALNNTIERMTCVCFSHFINISLWNLTSSVTSQLPSFWQAFVIIKQQDSKRSSLLSSAQTLHHSPTWNNVRQLTVCFHIYLVRRRDYQPRMNGCTVLERLCPK